MNVHAPSIHLRLSLGLLLASWLTACPKIPGADPLEAPPSVLSFKASAGKVAAGTRVKLSWSVENATEVAIDQLGRGPVMGAPSTNEGEVEVPISEDSLFALTARNARGASDRAVTVVRVDSTSGQMLFVAVPDTISAGQSSTLVWSAPGASGLTLTATPGGAVDVGGQAGSGSVAVTPATTTSYRLSAGERSSTITVTVQPSVLSFAASSLSAAPGGTVTLSWATAGATRVQLSAVGRGVLVDEMEPARVSSGSFDDMLPAQADPGQLFTYLLTVSGLGVTVTEHLTVSIQGSPAIVSFEAPAYARQVDGGTLALSWQTREADLLSIAADGVEIYRAPTPEEAALGALVVPTPPADVVYTLKARGKRGGEAVATKTVDVVSPPTVMLAPTPASVAGGAPLSVSWTGQHIRGVIIEEVGFGSVYSATGALDTGMATLFPNADPTRYLIVVDNTLGDSATATVQVSVTSPISLRVAEPGTLRVGQNVNLSWSLPGRTPPIVGIAHDAVAQRSGSTGFDDIATTGRRLTFPSVGNPVATLNTPFRTTLFGQIVGQLITVSRHGYLAFGYVNGSNSVDEALPTSKLEPLAVAPYWEELALSANVFWQVKTVGGMQVLIVQWGTASPSFQAKIFASGQIDFEYRSLPTNPSGRVGITGLRLNQTIIGPTPAQNVGLTFFGPKPSPLTLRVLTEGPLVGSLDLGSGQLLRVSANLAAANYDELIINEALADSTLGVSGQWVELRNMKDTAVELEGWTFNLADAGALPLRGTVPPRGLLVLGASMDSALNDDAGVQVELPNFDLTGLSALTLGRAGPHSTLALGGFDAGVAVVSDLGPYRVSSGSVPGRCQATAPFGAGPQRGTPGRDIGCGFPYALASCTPGYFDISDGGTPLMSNLDDEIAVVDLASAPVPFSGVPRTALQVSTNGFATFDSSPADPSNYHSSATPSTTDSNLVLAVFADDLFGNPLLPGTQVYAKRVSLGEDPFASAPHWIVQWQHFSYFTFIGSSTSLADDYNFQIKLFDDGVIEYHYQQMVSTSSSQYGSGRSAVSWLEGENGTALTINALSSIPGILPRSAFRFVPR